MESNAFLVIQKGYPYEPGTWVALEFGENVIGRGTAQTLPTIYFSNQIISRFHCIISYNQGEWRICDTKSRHGTQVNNKNIHSETPVLLADGDHINLGKDTVIFRFVNSCDADKTIDESIIIEMALSKEKDVLPIGLIIDLERMKLMMDNKAVFLSVKEWKLLTALYKNLNKITPYETLKTKVWPERIINNNPSDVSPEELNILIYRLRKKLGKYGVLLQTVRGQGCILESKSTDIQ